MGETRTIEVDYLARVEGEGRLNIVMEDGEATEVKLVIFEPPRFFEGFLRGRSSLETPDITARICGICPVAYQMSACHAVEDAFGIVLPDELRRLRRLLYCGEWIESHALHMFMLHAPDFLGFQDAVQMAGQHRGWVQKGLSIKKAGNDIVNVLGGREIHPINVKVGGFYRAPRRGELEALLGPLKQAQADAEAALSWMATFDFPDLERDWEMVALRHERDYPFSEGRVVSSAGLDIDVHDYPDHFVEQHVAHSTALHSARKGDRTGPYHVGPMARFNLDHDRLGGAARKAADGIGLTVPCRNPFKSLLVRGVELVQALDEAQRIIADYREPAAASLPVEPRAGVGQAATEAPRGLLYHRYRIDDQGLVEEATIIPPTSQNQATIEDDLRALAPALATMSHEDATWRAEQAVRNYDPCISCSTHFLTLSIQRTGEV